MRTLSFGEILFDIIEGEHLLGGAPLNFAAHLAKIGADSYIFSRVGKDELGNRALTEMNKIGIKIDFIERDHTLPTGTVEVFLKEGQPDYTIFEPVAYDHIDFENNEKALLETNFDILYMGTLAQRNKWSRNTLTRLIQHKKFSHIFYDINLRKGFYTKEILHDSMKACTILKLNNEEVSVLSSMFFGEELDMERFSLKIAKEYNIDVVVITTGASGCLIYDHGKINFVKGYPVRVVDTVGAGDAFSAAFVYNYWQFGNAVIAADIANKLGAYVASCRGPIPAYSEEIRNALNAHR